MSHKNLPICLQCNLLLAEDITLYFWMKEEPFMVAEKIQMDSWAWETSRTGRNFKILRTNPPFNKLLQEVLTRCFWTLKVMPSLVETVQKGKLALKKRNCPLPLCQISKK